MDGPSQLMNTFTTLPYDGTVCYRQGSVYSAMCGALRTELTDQVNTCLALKWRVKQNTGFAGQPTDAFGRRIMEAKRGTRSFSYQGHY